MAKQKILSLVAWLTGVIVSLTVGYSMIIGTLTLPWWLGGEIYVPMVAGYVVVITTAISVVLAIIKK